MSKDESNGFTAIGGMEPVSMHELQVKAISPSAFFCCFAPLL